MATGRVPTYKALCLAILNNDLMLTSLGFTPIKTNKLLEFDLSGGNDLFHKRT